YNCVVANDRPAFCFLFSLITRSSLLYHKKAYFMLLSFSMIIFTDVPLLCHFAHKTLQQYDTINVDLLKGAVILLHWKLLYKTIKKPFRRKNSVLAGLSLLQPFLKAG